MIISLIGMSGSGKTYWSKKLKRSGFIRYSIDDLIETELKKKSHNLKSRGIKNVAKWMGQPFEPQYQKASLAYLSTEEEAMLHVLSLIEKKHQASQDIVIDTTGSVIYLKKNILDQLARLTKIIYIKISQETEIQMYKLYLKKPKPVIWGHIFSPKNGEDNLQALARCYPELLKYRTNRYQKLAHLTLDASRLKSPSFTTEKLISSCMSDKKTITRASHLSTVLGMTEQRSKTY